MGFIQEQLISLHSVLSWLPDKPLLWASLITYAIFSIGLMKRALQRKSDDLPENYYMALGASMVSLLLTGVVLGDAFIMLSRGVTLIFVAWVYMAVAFKSGHLAWDTHRGRISAVVLLIFLTPASWAEFPEFQSFVTVHHKTLEWATIALMFFFVVKGQGFAAGRVAKRMIDGDYTLKGFAMQIDRFAGFAFQAIHYGIEYGLTDTRFIVNALGALGASRLLGWYWRILLRLWRGRQTEKAVSA